MCTVHSTWGNRYLVFENEKMSVCIKISKKFSLFLLIIWKGKIGITFNHIHRIYRNRSILRKNVPIIYKKEKEKKKIKSGFEFIIENPLVILLSSKTLKGIQCFYLVAFIYDLWKERHYSNLIGKIKRNSIAKDEIFLEK